MDTPPNPPSAQPFFTREQLEVIRGITELFLPHATQRAHERYPDRDRRCAIAPSSRCCSITARGARIFPRIAQLRKEAGLSQQTVADTLEIAQQTYANYEVARARPAVSMLPTL